MLARRFPVPHREQKIDDFYDVFCSDDISHDWYVIKAFYTALHILGAAYEALEQSYKPNNHHDTHKAYRESRNIPRDIYRDYKRLYSLSLEARYGVTNISAMNQVESDEAEQLLDNILSWARGACPDVTFP